MNSSYSGAELMTIAAARSLSNDDICFVGIGAPSAACNLARLMHAPRIVLIYESGTIGTGPDTLPLSIGDGELYESAVTAVSVPEMFRYWLQGERINLGFLGGAQIDRFANLNTSVIGDYNAPSVRLPGGGGAPEIATCCGRIFITMSMTSRAFVERLPFITSLGHGSGPRSRAQLGLRTRGPTRVITDLCILEPEPESCELQVVALYPGVDAETVRSKCGWPLRFAPHVSQFPAPDDEELKILRDLQTRTRLAHGDDA